MNRSVNEMVRWLGDIDANAASALDMIATAGGDPGQVHAMKQCVTMSVVFLAQILRACESESKDSYDSLVPDPPMQSVTSNAYESFVREFNNENRNN